MLEPCGEVTALIGDNGQGKTNAIEAVYLVSALRPLRPVARRALIRSGGASARIAATVRHQRSGLEHHVEVRLEGATRVLLKDDKRVPTEAFLGSLVAISFTPDDLHLPKAGPEARRRFLDRALLNARPSYLGCALRYARAMRDRNRLLAVDASDAELDVFEAVLAKEGARMVEARARYVDRIRDRVAARFDDIARPAPRLSLRYASNVPDGPRGREEALLAALAQGRSRDRRRATTGVGPHLDDLHLSLDGALARDRASQGQHRALVLALKLVEIEELTAELGEPPLLLLDDMSSELDASRTRQLFEVLRALDGQVLLTSTATPEAVASALGSGRRLTVQRVRAGRLEAPEALDGADAALPSNAGD